MVGLLEMINWEKAIIHVKSLEILFHFYLFIEEWKFFFLFACGVSFIISMFFLFQIRTHLYVCYQLCILPYGVFFLLILGRSFLDPLGRSIGSNRRSTYNLH